MTLTGRVQHDALRPSVDAALAAWSDRVRADHDQVERCREVEDPADFYGPVAHRFRTDPRRDDDAVGRELVRLARPMDRWLDIGAGGGRYALPIALVTREVIALDPSDAMLGQLRSAMDDHGVRNIGVERGRWPPLDRADPGTLDRFRSDVVLMAHVGYDIEAIGPFLDAAEAAARRMCVAVMGARAMTTVASRYWMAIHGEPRVALPAFPELLTLLLARDRLPEVRLVDRAIPTFESLEALLEMARRQLWVRPGSDRDRSLEQRIRSDALEADGAWYLPDERSRIAVVTWDPPGI